MAAIHAEHSGTPALATVGRTYVGTAGWSLERAIAPASKPQLTPLERYAEYFNCVEVDAAFPRRPRPSTLERWRDSTPPGFRFAVNVPHSIIRDAAQAGGALVVRQLLRLLASLEPKLGPVSVLLPASSTFDAHAAETFLRNLVQVGAGQVAIEAHHPSWFSERADAILERHGAVRVLSDPAPYPGADTSASRGDFTYFRCHGAPRARFSAYPPEAISDLSVRLKALSAISTRHDVYCVFDNTALGAAAVNALSLKAEVDAPPPRVVRWP